MKLQTSQDLMKMKMMSNEDETAKPYFWLGQEAEEQQEGGEIERVNEDSDIPDDTSGLKRFLGLDGGPRIDVV